MPSSNSIFKKFNSSIELIKNKKFDSIYFLMGDDQFLQSVFIDQLKDELSKVGSIDKIILSVEEFGSKQIISKINESDLFSTRKIIILRSPNSLRGKTRDELLDYCLNPISDKYLVLIQDEFSLKNKLVKGLSTSSTAVSTSTPFENELKMWVSYFFKENGFNNIPAKIIDDLISIFGESVFTIKNEIDKLCLGLTTDSNLDSAVLNEDIHLGRSYKKFELFNYIGKRDIFSSIKLGRSLVSKDSSMLDLIRPLNELFQELLFVKIFKGTNRPHNSFSLLSPSIRKNIPLYANNYTSKEIVQAIRKLANIDKQIKTSKIDDKSAITEFVFSATSNE